jgi:DNA-binding MarR family transcriptional regulator
MDLEFDRRHLIAADALALDVVFGIRAAGQALDNTLGPLLAQDRLSPGRLQMLLLIQAAGRPVTQKELSAGLAVTPATVSGLIDKLVRDGLVSSAPDPADHRKLFTVLTAGGHQVLARQIEAVTKRMRRALRGLTAAEENLLVGLLQRARLGLVGVTRNSARPDVEEP